MGLTLITKVVPQLWKWLQHIQLLYPNYFYFFTCQDELIKSGVCLFSFPELYPGFFAPEKPFDIPLVGH
jgi:hypothetical protein